MKKTVVISVGGSLIVPDGIDTAFLSNFKDCLLFYIQKGYSFVIICGGGKTARRYQEAAQQVTELTREDVDWLGIHSTRLNAHLLRTVFYKWAHPVIVNHPDEPVDFKQDILVASGWRPGFSTDYCAVTLAKTIGAKTIVNLSNIDYVYDSDPRTNPAAKPFTELSWASFRKLIPDSWDPGLHSPFDPVASKLADESRMEVVILNGAKLSELENYLECRPFVGTRIT